MSSYILGLDLGPNSVGWAMIEAGVTDDTDRWTHEAMEFADTTEAGHPPLGVRVFEAGLANLNSSKEVALNQKRRQMRSLRRNNRRRNDRRRELRRQLTDWGYLPGPGAARERLFTLDPYALRSEALDRPLSKPELARVFIHFSQRRGFKSNRRSGSAQDDRGMLKEISDLAKAIEEDGARTLGEYFHRLRRHSGGAERVRAIHTRRDMYASEFDLLKEAQTPHHPELDEGRWGILHHLLFRQMDFEVTSERRARTSSRANLHRAPSVGRCPLEPDERCCHRGRWIAQEFRILKEVNNLRVQEDWGRFRELAPNERGVVLQELRSNQRRKFDDLRKKLHRECGMEPDARFNLERGGRSFLDGNTLEDRLRKSFSRRNAETPWKDLAEETRVELREAMMEAGDQELERRLRDAGLSEEATAKLVALSPADGYLGYSEKAIRRLVPHLLNGKGEWEAIQAVYPNRPEAAAVKLLPPLSSKELPNQFASLTNPLVRRALVEVRKVVNCLVRDHGRPARIVVELARDMKEGPEGRRKASKRMRERAKARDQARSHVESLIGAPCTRRDVERFLIWEAQGRRCLYTGAPISQSRLYSSDWEIDHILPRSRSLDDSFANKALVSRTSNAEKGNRTVREWLGVDSQAYREIMQRADEAGLPPGTRSRLEQDTFDADGFASRQLNDTRYISRLVVRYLELLYDPALRTGEKVVQSSRGSLTAELRRRWGLNGILDLLSGLDGEVVPSAVEPDEGIKSREDHRHHAIDAVVVALSSRAHLKRYQDYWRAREQGAGDAPELLPPWASLREDTEHHLDQVVVSHRVMRRVSGGFHEETFFGMARDGRGDTKPGVFTTRKALHDLTGNAIPRIRSKEVQAVLTEVLSAKGWDGASNTLPKDWWVDGVVNRNGLPIKRVRIEANMKNPITLGKEKHRFAVGGNNHHLDFQRSLGGPDDVHTRVRCVPMLEVAKRVRTSGNLVPPPEEGHGRLYTISRKETVSVRDSEGNRRLAVVQKFSGRPTFGTSIDLYLRDIRDGRPAKLGNKSPLARIKSVRRWTELDPIKVQVDPLGRVSPAGD